MSDQRKSNSQPGTPGAPGSLRREGYSTTSACPTPATRPRLHLGAALLLDKGAFVAEKTGEEPLRTVMVLTEHAVRFAGLVAFSAATAAHWPASVAAFRASPAH